MSIKELVLKTRSYRRFDQTVIIDMDTLRELVDLARLSASGANMQPLKYVLVCDAEMNEKVFSSLGWAGYLKDWPGPAEGEKPTAYIVILCDTTIRKNAGVDHGIAAQSMLLGASEKGLGGCMIASFDKEALGEILRIPSTIQIELVVALGKPIEQVEIVPVGENGSIKYWRDADGVHYVPKRDLDDLIVQF